ncbi:MAG: hypothetical protein EPN39_19800 [Chitinophagaceae bacterium]|nr:MAG: hypothetical protein EPN39_19800 [Chitinophagaceae bacterium]
MKSTNLRDGKGKEFLVLSVWLCGKIKKGLWNKSFPRKHKVHKPAGWQRQGVFSALCGFAGNGDK